MEDSAKRLEKIVTRAVEILFLPALIVVGLIYFPYWTVAALACITCVLIVQD